MKCSNCKQELKKNNKFCPNCGNENLDYRENFFDKNIDKTIESVQRVNTKIVDEISESEHIQTIVERLKKYFNLLNNGLSNIFFIVGIVTIIYSFIYEPNLYTNVYNYTKPDEYSAAPFGHLGYLFLYVSVLLLIPISFIYIKFSKSVKIKRWIIPLIILFMNFLIIYYSEFIESDAWKDGLM